MSSLLQNTVGSLTQIRMGKGSATFTNKGPIRGQNIFLMAEYVRLIDTFYSNYYFRRLSLLFPSIDYIY